MKILFCSAGKAHETYVKQGISDFTSRVNKYFSAEWLLIAPPKNAYSMSEDELKKKEAKNILSAFRADDYIVLLDERGKQMSSADLAIFMQQRANESIKRIVFLIGGAYGVNEAVIKKANYTWSLSKLVFPHMLVRLILAEQVYRACTILRNEKYHHA